MNNIEKFEDFLDRIQGLLDNAKKQGHIIVRVEDLENAFPELKEGEDEKIRKALIKFHKSTIDIDGIKGGDILAWLEKQGQTFTKKDVDDAYLKGVCDTKQELEKQGEQKKTPIEGEFPYDNPSDTLDGEIENIWGKLNSGGRFSATKEGFREVITHFVNYIKEQDYRELVEQKPADNVKPKFKAGDWVVVNDGRIGRISECTKDFADVDFEFSRLSTRVNNIRFWTIQDAKDGDVLAYPDGSITLFKYMDENIYMAHVLLVDGHIELNNSCAIFNVHPATKEQREFLFKKMKEAGYEWDVEKKELKKIEQKHICELDNSYARVKFPFRARVKSSGKIVTIFDGQLSESGKEWIKYQSDSKDYYSVYEPDDLELVCNVEQKSDEKYNITGIGSKHAEGNLGEMVKNLKPVNEVLEQKPAWSEEDSPYYDDICELLINILHSESRNYNMEAIKKDLDWLKSLKDRYTWKPSDKQMKALDEVYKTHGANNVCRHVLFNLMNDLKKLIE